MHFPSSKHAHKKTQRFLRPDFCHESGGGARHKSNYPKKLLLLCRCQRLIHRTLKTFPNPLLPYYSKIYKKRKISLRTPATLDFPPSLQPKRHIDRCLAFLESVHSDATKRRARISRITSKMAYHNQWAAGPPPPSPPTLNPQILPRRQTDTAVAVFHSGWQRPSGAIRVCIKQVGGFLRMLIALQRLLLMQSAESGSSN